MNASHRRTLKVALAVVGGLVVLVAAVVAWATHARQWHTEPPEKFDRATIVTAEDLGIHTAGNGDEWRSFRGFDMADHVEYRRTGIRSDGKGHVLDVRIDEETEVAAKTGFASGASAGRMAFNWKAGPGEEMKPLELASVRADELTASEYRVTDKPAGVFVFARVGKHLWMFELNGYVLPQPTLESVVEDRLDRLRQLDP